MTERMEFSEIQNKFSELGAVVNDPNDGYLIVTMSIEDGNLSGWIECDQTGSALKSDVDVLFGRFEGYDD